MQNSRPVDPRQSEDIVWRYVLERNATRRPDAAAVTFPFDDEQRWTWSELDQRANRAANTLAGLGIGKGDFVAVFSENTPQLLQTFFGATKLGAIISPVNTAFRGEILRHILELSEARVIVADAALVPRIDELKPSLCTAPTRLVFSGEQHAPDPAFAGSISFDEIVGSSPAHPPADPGIAFWDSYAMICTSGTTGVSKGVMSPYGQIHASVRYVMLPRATEDDVFLVDAPLFHVGGMLSLETALLTGAEVVVCPRIHVGGYWERIRKFGITHATPMVMRWLLEAPELPDDADNPLQRILVSTWTDGIQHFCSRFGVDEAYGMFNMTEISGPLLQNPKLGSIGTPRPGAEVRLVDEFDIEVPVGEVGELLVRTDLPWEMNSGYHRMPDATNTAWRNGWFHTGDLMRCDEEGNFYFVDRRKDSIRIRGENVSSIEVEREVVSFDRIRECAAFGIAVPDGEEAIKVCVVLYNGTTLDPNELIEHLRTRLPYFAIPRFIEVRDELPKTTDHENYGKIRKAELRAEGITSRTWDRDAEGVVVDRRS